MNEDPITRPEFESALESLRREIASMGEHLGSDLSEIRSQLTKLLNDHQKDGREIGQLTVRVEYLEKARDTEKGQRWALVVGLAVSLLGHLLTILRTR